MAISDYIASLQDNPYFGAGFGLVGIGAILAVSKKGLQYGTIFLRRHYMMTLEVPSRDKSYHWLLQWITNYAKRTQHLSVETTFRQSESGKIDTQFDFVPSPGNHYFRYKNNWIFVERNREKMMDLHSGIPFETVTLTSIGRNKEMFFDILSQAREAAMQRQEGKTIMYVAMGTEWRQFGYPRRKRPISSVVLDEGISESILRDVSEFINNPKWYSDRGIPYRRGFLLHGPPGCGKSSYIMALAGELQYSICMMNLSERTQTDDRLNHLMNVAPQQSIILLEDIDAAFISREKETEEEKLRFQGLSRVTLSGLLNTLDGVASTEGRIVFMTTNYLNRLDPALIRPGRVDVIQEIGYATEYQLKQMYFRFYPELGVEKAIEFANQVTKRNKPVSIASIQGFFMIHKNNGLDVFDKIDSLWR